LLGEDWVRKGIFSHGLYISAADADVINALFAIGFGKERVDGLMDLRTATIPEVEEPTGITIRRAGKGDNDHLGSLSQIIMTALGNAPYWHPTVPEDRKNFVKAGLNWQMTRNGRFGWLLKRTGARHGRLPSRRRG